MMSQFAQLVFSSNVSGLRDAIDMLNGVKNTVLGMGKSVIDAADKLDDLSSRTNISVERLSVLTETAKLSAGSFDMLVAGAEELAKKLSKQDEKTGDVARSLAKLNVKLVDENGVRKSGLKLQEDVIEAAEKMDDKHKAEALAVSILGSKYYELRGIVDDVKKKKKEMYDLMSSTGGIVTKALATQMGDFNDTLTKLGTVSKSIGTSLLKVAGPALVWAANKIYDFYSAFAKVMAKILGTNPESEQAKDKIDATKLAIAELKKMANDKSGRIPEADRKQAADNIAIYEAELSDLNRLHSKMLKVEADFERATLDGRPDEGTGTKGTGNKADEEREKEAKKKEQERLDALSRAGLAYLKRMDELHEQEEKAGKEHYDEMSKRGLFDVKMYEDAEEAAGKVNEELNKQALAMIAQIEPNNLIFDTMKKIEEMREKGMLTEEQKLRLLKEQNALITNEADTFAAGWENAFRKFDVNAKQSADLGKTAFESMSQNMEDAIFKFSTTGKLSFADFTRSVLADIARQQAKAAASGILKFIMAGVNAYAGGGTGGLTAAFSQTALGGSGFGSGLAYGNADIGANLAIGGPVREGESYIVGEQGPEVLKMGAQSGRIVPAGGGGVNVGSINIQVNGGKTNEETGSAVSAAVMNTMKQIAKGEIANQRRPGGMLAA